MVNLATCFVSRGIRVDLVLARAVGPFLRDVPDTVRIIDLNARRVLASLPGLVRYLRRERPTALLSTISNANLVALWARKLARVQTRVVVRQATILNVDTSQGANLRDRVIPWLVARVYREADGIVAISRGVADDLVVGCGLPSSSVQVIHNPAITSDLFVKAAEKLEHDWFAPGEFPVILGAGRLTQSKDFPTLIRAFARLRRQQPMRLMILGEGEERSRLEYLAQQLGIQEDFALPGFVTNPFKYMKQASVFVLSSLWEGFGNVLVEALALGTPVVSTNCPGGPAEILQGGNRGHLVPIGDEKALAAAIVSALRERQQNAPTALEEFKLERIADQYYKALFV